MKATVLAIVALALLSVSACRQETTSAAASQAPATAATPDRVSATNPVPRASSAGTGVAECHRYLEKVHACISGKVPEAQRELMRHGVDQSRASWQAASDKRGLATQCTAALIQARTAFASVGCAL